MSKTSLEKRREVRKLEARRDDLMVKAKKARSDLAATRAQLKTARAAR